MPDLTPLNQVDLGPITPQSVGLPDPASVLIGPPAPAVGPAAVPGLAVGGATVHSLASPTGKLYLAGGVAALALLLLMKPPASGKR